MDTQKMNDFDFEELDKAVNSLAAKTEEEHAAPSAAQPSEPPKPAPQPMPTSSPAAESPKREAEKPQDSSPAPLISHPSSPRINRRGAFMDIVPPNPRKTSSRVAPTLQPVTAPTDSKPEPPTTPPLEEPKPEPETTPADIQETPTPPAAPVPSVQPEPPTPDTPKTGDDVHWPDPLDFHDVDKLLEDEPSQEQKHDEKPAQTSPFLAEAKVEKRPLGAFSNFKTEEQPPKTIAEPAATPEPVADELTPDKEGTFTEPEAPHKPEAIPNHETQDEKDVASSAADKEEAPAKTDETSRHDMHSAAMMSIPQQYRTEQKAADKSTRSVFDTKEYHPPLAEAALKEHHGSSIWTKLFIAFVVLVLLGVAGYFVYLFVFASK